MRLDIIPTFDQSEVKTKVKEKKDKNIVMSGQFCTLAMFYLLCELHDLQKFLLADSGVSSAEEFLLVLIKLANEDLRTDKIYLCISQLKLMC